MKITITIEFNETNQTVPASTLNKPANIGRAKSKILNAILANDFSTLRGLVRDNPEFTKKTFRKAAKEMEVAKVIQIKRIPPEPENSGRTITMYEAFCGTKEVEQQPK